MWYDVSYYSMGMNADRLLAMIAICVAIVAVAISCCSLFSNHDNNELDSSDSNFTDIQIKDLVGKLLNKGGKIYTAQGGIEISSSRWTIDIEDRMLICHFKTYSQDYYIPFDSIDYIWVNR